jgi:hypothetical protein
MGLFLVSLIGSFVSVGVVICFTLYLVNVGMTPFVASPTAMFLTLLQSSSSSLMYMLNGKINYVLAGVGSLVILIFSMGTRLTIYKTVLKKGKGSVIMIYIIILIMVSIPANI